MSNTQSNPVAVGFSENLNQSQLQLAEYKMAEGWNHMLTMMVIGNAECTKALNQLATTLTDEMDKTFSADVYTLENDPYYDPAHAGKKDVKKESLPEIEKNIAILEAQMNELQSTSQSATQSVLGLSDDTSNKAKEEVDSSQTLIGQTASQIDTTLYQAAMQAANGISA
jgi:hypothetical protein